jgi:hypothetical protein
MSTLSIRRTCTKEDLKTPPSFLIYCWCLRVSTAAVGASQSLLCAQYIASWVGGELLAEEVLRPGRPRPAPPRPRPSVGSASPVPSPAPPSLLPLLPPSSKATEVCVAFVHKGCAHLFRALRAVGKASLDAMCARGRHQPVPDDGEGACQGGQGGGAQN